MKAKGKLAVLITSAVLGLSVMGCGEIAQSAGDTVSSGSKTDNAAKTDKNHDGPGGFKLNSESSEKASLEDAAETKEASEDTPEKTSGTDGASTEKSVENLEEKVSAVDPSLVYGNGGYFVQVGDYVYYHVYSEGALEKNAIWGEFLVNTSTGKSDMSSYEASLCRENINTKEVETIATDHGYGPIFSDGTNLYFTEHEDADNSHVKYYSIDGESEGIIAEGTIKGCDAMSGLLAVYSYEKEPYATKVSLYHGKDYIGEHKTEAGFEYVGISGDGIFLMMPEYGEKSKAVYYHMTADGSEVVELGESNETYDYGMPNHEQFLATDDEVYFVLTDRGGTAMMINGVQVLKATPGKEGSLEQVEIPEKYTASEYEPIKPVLYLDDSGQVAFSQIPPGTPVVGSFNEGGDLMFTFKPDEYEIVIEQFRSTPPTAKEGEMIYFQQAGEYLNEDFYLIIATAHRTPEEDVGWRESYGIDKLEYILVDPDTGEETDLGSVIFQR